MKNRLLKTINLAALTFLIWATFAQTSASAQHTSQEDQSQLQTQEDSPARQNEKRIEGMWDVQVTIHDCQTGAGLRTFPSTTTFIAGGTLFDSTAGIPQSLKTPGHGIWRYIGGNIYRIKTKSFNFDVNNNYVGWTIINHEVTINRRADESESAGTAEVYAPNGMLIVTLCSSTTAKRFE